RMPPGTREDSAHDRPHATPPARRVTELELVIKPPGKLLPLVAALLCGAVLAQAASPSSPDVTSAAAPAASTPDHGLLSTPVTSKRGEPSSTKRATPPTKPTAPKPPADDWNLNAHGKVLYLTFDDGPQHEWTPK